MRKLALTLAAAALLSALPAAAQNTDIESLSGLQFNFGNPGARSLGMGGAFLGLADDASAAEANPAGLTILRKPEISIEGRNYLEAQVMTTSGIYPEVERTSFSHYSKRAEITFGSFVYPVKRFTFGLYYHQPLKNEGAGAVVPQRNEFTGEVEKDVPSFYLPRGGPAPVDRDECIRIVRATNDPTACAQWGVNPFVSAVDVQQRTWGVAAAYNFGKLSVGATARYQLFREESFTFRLTPTFAFHSISVQATAQADGDEVEVEDATDLTFAAGFKFAMNDKLSFGGVYKQGAQFAAPTFLATPDTGLAFVKVADTTFHMPDIMGVGVSFRPIPVLTINVDAIYVTYENLVDDFHSTITGVQAVDQPFKVNNATELHIGGEYFFSTRIPLAVRAGYWRDPDHSLTWNGPLNTPDTVAAAMLYPEGEAQNHFSVGLGLAWPRFQVDAAYDTSDRFKVGSISFVTRF